MADETKRVIDQTTDQSLSAGDFIIVDSQSEGTRKFDLGTELTDIKQDLQDHEDRIDALEQGGSTQGLTEEFKQALHDIIEQLGFEDDEGRSYLSALDNAMWPPKPATSITLSESSLSFVILNNTHQLTATVIPSDTTDSVTWSSSDSTVATVSSNGLVTSIGYGSATITATAGSVSATCSVVVAQATVSSISAVYTQSGTVYDTDSLDSLKSDLVVTATYTDSSTETVPSTDYTLSGTLEEGTSTITVSYANKTTTFNVTVTHFVDTSLHNWDFTQSLTDSQGGLTAILSDSGASRDSTGLHITSGSGYCVLGNLNPNIGIAIELDISSMSRQGSNHGRLLMRQIGVATTGTGDGLVYNKSGYWAFYLGSWSASSGITDPNDFAGKTIRVEISSDGGTQKLYVDNVLKFTNTKETNYSAWQIGSSSNSFYNITITGVRVYALEVE